MKIKTYIRWEQLRKKSFYSFDPMDREDYTALLYVRALERGSAQGYTLDEFRRTVVNSHLNNRQAEEAEREFSVQRQFLNREKQASGGSQGEPMSFSDIAAWLIAEGLDAHFVMEELEQPDLEPILKAYKNRKTERMETERFWTWLGMLPHIDAKKFPNGVKDIVRFPWEEEDDNTITEQDIRTFEAFMASNQSH